MLAFDDHFEDLAIDECIVMHLGTGRRRSTYVFRELYCPDPRCRCGELILEAIHIETRRRVAAIHYRLEPQGLVLDSDFEGDAEAERVADAFAKLLFDDPRHHATLVRHDKLMHPDRPQRQPRPRKAKVLPDQTPGLIVTRAATSDSKTQQRFRKALEKVGRLRTELAHWKGELPNIHRELAAYAALAAQHAHACGTLVRLLDQAHATAKLSRSERADLRRLIIEIAADLLSSPSPAHDDIKAIYNRHTRGDVDRELAELAELVELAAAPPATERPPTPRKPSARKVAEQRNADKAVQDVYRSLARAFHPDHEQDPDERARKASLMTEVNVAHESRDLLRLLELQLQLEQVEPARAESVADERARHFIRILDEQARQLADELAALHTPFRFQLDLSPRARLEPVDVLAALRRDAAALQSNLDGVTADIAACTEPARVKHWLRDVVAA